MTVIEGKNKDAYATTTNLNYFIALENVTKLWIFRQILNFEKSE